MLDINEIYLVNCLDGIKKIDDESVDLILTDPPYGLSKKGITNDESLKLFYDILPDCCRVLKKDAFFITFLYLFNKNAAKNRKKQIVVH